jgi:hypothetical protein
MTPGPPVPVTGSIRRLLTTVSTVQKEGRQDASPCPLEPLGPEPRSDAPRFVAMRGVATSLANAHLL